MSEQDYINGSRAAWQRMLNLCLQNLGYEDKSKESWIEEREAAIAILRELCAEYGDNDWENHAHLADVIDKHFGRYLDK